MVGAVGLGDDQGAVGFEVYSPVAFVDQVVVSATERDEVVEIGGAAVLPRGRCGGFGSGRRPWCRYRSRRWGTWRVGLGVVCGSRPVLAARGEGFAVGVDDGGQDDGFAHGPAHGFGRQWAPELVSQTLWSWRPSLAVAASITSTSGAVVAGPAPIPVRRARRARRLGFCRSLGPVALGQGFDFGVDGPEES